MIKGTLFLSGGGGLEKNFELDKAFFSCLKSGSKILYIPIALKRDAIGFEACWDWFSSVVSTHCGDKDLDFSMFLENEPFPDLNDYDAIYFGGGNTFKLLNYFYKNKIINSIIDYLKNGKIIYGGSAGAIIFGKDIRTVEEENDLSYTHFNGLDMVGGQSFICHYEDDMDEHIFEVVKKIKSSVIALKEECGLIFKDGKIQNIGQVYVFNEDGSKTSL